MTQQQLLNGLRIVDLSRVMSGPYCTALLADVGAEVIKIETPVTGDDSRHFGPFVDGRSVYFSLLNRNKKSVTLNLKDERAREMLYALIDTADAVVENFRPGVAQRLGVDYETLKARNPSLVYLSISGFGQQGEFKGRPAYDLIIQAMSGLMSTTGRPGQEPTCVGDSVADLVTGLFGAWSLMTALFARERDGQGRQIDLSMFDAMLALQLTSASRLFASGTAPQRVGNRHPVTSPVDCFEARDGWAVIVVSNDGFFRRFAPLIGKPEWVEDPRFVDNLQRARNEPALKAAITAWSRERTVDEVVQACLEADVPAGPVWDLQQAHAQAARQDRGRVAQAQDAERPWPFVLQPAVFSSGDPAKVQADPLLGAHTDEVLQGIGIAPADLAQLRARGAV
jgi:CoA:oxalate CoA-transferase